MKQRNDPSLSNHDGRLFHFLIVVLALLWPALPLAARTLHWSALDVQARLDADGRLHVVERQAMVFDGDWNGGERRFRMAKGQKLELHGMTRVDRETGERIEMVKGNLDRVDHYGWAGSEVLRWRSRLPSDPSFQGRRIDYILDYTLSKILVAKGERYLLDHDFAFSDRFGDIEDFNLHLELDPVWSHEGPNPLLVSRSNMRPGESHVVTVELAFDGKGSPSQAPRAVPFVFRLGLFLATLTAVVLLFARLLRFEKLQGRFTAVPMPEPFTRPWLEEHLLSLRAEEAGALWDQSIGGPEVAALIARLTGEGKLASEVHSTGGKRAKGTLELKLRVDRDEFEGYERELIDKLFFGGRTITDTTAVKSHYKSSGFSPSGVISSKLKERLKRLPGFAAGEPPPSKKPTLLLLAATLLCVLLEVLLRGMHAFAILPMVILPAFLPSAIAYFFVYKYRTKADGRVMLMTAGFLIPLAAILGGQALPVLIGTMPALSGVGTKASVFGLLAPLLFGLTLANSFFNNARTRDSKEAVRRRRSLAGIRRWFREQLKIENPQIEDEWLPYLLAFGLDSDVSRWGVNHGGRSDFTSMSRPSSGGSSIPSWTGGGGTFGGAGATAAWSAAATGLAAGVASPSSSSGGGGGGGGGGSSGGGGGGGW